MIIKHYAHFCGLRKLLHHEQYLKFFLMKLCVKNIFEYKALNVYCVKTERVKFYLAWKIL